MSIICPSDLENNYVNENMRGKMGNLTSTILI